MMLWLVDAGTIGSQLLLHEQQSIQSILLTHLHYDHIEELPTLADYLIGETKAPVQWPAFPKCSVDRVVSCGLHTEHGHPLSRRSAGTGLDAGQYPAIAHGVLY